jgi:AraC-like DNA-binding protein
MYKMRITGQLTTTEVFLLDDTIYSLESLNNASTEFDILLTDIVRDLKETGEIYLRRIRLMVFGLFSSAILVLGLSFMINRQLKTAQKSRTKYLKEQKNQLLRRICENSSEENLMLFTKKQQNLEVRLSLEKPILLMLLQIDDYSSFSHQLNLGEQNTMIGKYIETIEMILEEEKLSCESFLYKDDMIIFLANFEKPDDYDGLLHRMEIKHNELLLTGKWSVSMTMGDINTEVIDLDHDFSSLLRLANYRFLIGKGAYIYSGSTQLEIQQPFHYPIEKERLFEETLNSLNLDETLRILDEMINYGLPYGPQSMRRLILRLTASLSSIVENLERTYHITSMGYVIPMILQIQNPEYINDVKNLLKEIITRVIKTCTEKTEEKHDQTVLQIKKLIAHEINDYNLSADSMANRFNLTSSYINRLFKKHTSYSIAGYINNLRLEHAEEHLRSTNMTISEIAENSGFASMGTFFRIFKKKYGRTPKDYQREILNRESSLP